MIGLVLTAGGARGAYQAGVLKRISELPSRRGKPSPYPIIVGASAGAINSAAMAAGSEDFGQAARQVAELWAGLRAEDVFRTDLPALGKIVTHWLRDLSMGGLIGGGLAESLLDATPLRGFLTKHLKLGGIAGAIEQGHLHAVAITATSYYSGKSVIFIQGKPGHALWNKTRRMTLATPIQIDHILASSAIPVVFAPVRIRFEQGDFYLGDGGLRLVTPCSPAIRLGAERIFAIGIRSQQAALVRSQSELEPEGDARNRRFIMRRPPLAQVFGVALNAIFLDHLDTDIDHLKRINALLAAYGQGSVQNEELKEPMRPVGTFVVNPSVDLADVAEVHCRRMPKAIRYMMEGLGSSRSQSSDLMSYLLFDSHYTKALIDIGYQDAGQQAAEIEEFLSGASARPPKS